MPAIQRCFATWHDANADRFLVPVRRGERTPRSLRLDFPSLGLEETLYAALGDSEITVFADVEGECWDLLVSLDLVVPERAEGGWVCRHCVGGTPYIGHVPKLYGSQEDLWRDHLFEEFLAWVNERLARGDTLAFYRFGEGGTSACLLPADGRVRDTPPARTLPLRQHHTGSV
jgi:hypothetical protein